MSVKPYRDIVDLYRAAYVPNGKANFTVHDGNFHADDVAAVALASRLFGGSDNVNIIRTRDPLKFKGLVMDVGEGPLDHHGSASSTDSLGIPESSFSKVFNVMRTKLTPEQKAYLYFRKNVVDPVSKLDNGVPLRRGEQSLFNWVPSFNNNYSERGNSQAQDERFRTAVRMAEAILDRELQNAAVANTTAGIKAKILRKARNHDVVEVPIGLDVQDALAYTNAKFMLSPASDGSYRLQCVPQAHRGRFSQKIPFPNSWAGLRDNKLQSASGIPGAMFCHSGRFLAGFKSKEEALRAARKLIKQRQEK